MSRTASESEYIPIANRPATVLGTSIAFQIVAILAVCFRLYARKRLGHGFGVDDMFVILACSSTLAGTVFVDLQPGIGLGKHLSQLTMEEIKLFLFYTFGSLCTYAASTSLIKLSILFQYLRMIDRRSLVFHRVIIGMICLVASWGLIYFFMVIFSCNPVSGYWEIFKPARCALFGSRDDNIKVNTYLSQAASNMILDTIIFCLPLYILKTRFRSLSVRSRLGLLGVFALGFLAVMTSLLRLISMAMHRLGIQPGDYDTTWYVPITVIWTCVEVNVAVLCASIPIFWPVIEDYAFGKIYIVDEVEVNSEPRRTRTVDSLATDEQELALNLSWQDAHSKAAIVSTR